MTQNTAKRVLTPFVRPLVRQIQAYPPVTDAMRTALGITGSKKFLDTTLPAGSSEVAYQLQASRTR